MSPTSSFDESVIFEDKHMNGNDPPIYIFGSELKKSNIPLFFRNDFIIKVDFSILICSIILSIW